MAKSPKANKKAKKAPKQEAPKTEEQTVAQEEVKQEAPKKEKKAKKADKADKPKIRTLNALTKLLNSKIKASAKTSIEIGGLLSESQGHFKKAKDMLTWADDSFGLKKASVYNYIKINNVFGSEEMTKAFADVSIRILGELTRDDKMLDAALIAIKEEVTVDAEWLKEYKETKAAEAKEERKASGDLNDEDIAEEKAAEAEAKRKAQADADDAYLKETEAKVEKLEAEVETAKTTALAEHMTAVAKHLGKLKPHHALGVDAVADKRAVNKAKRALNALYKGHTEVLNVIEDAAKAMA